MLYPTLDADVAPNDISFQDYIFLSPTNLSVRVYAPKEPLQ
jgi:hypothetical protein